MNISSADLCKLSVQEVADLLLSDLHEHDKTVSGAIVHGVDDKGQMYSLYLKLEVFNDER